MCSSPSDNRFEIIDKVKSKLLDMTNISSSQDEMKVLDNILFRLWQIDELKQNVDFPDSHVSKNTSYSSLYYKHHSLIENIKEKITESSNTGALACECYFSQSLPKDICRFLIDKGYTISENLVVMSKTNNETVYGYKYIFSWRI